MTATRTPRTRNTRTPTVAAAAALAAVTLVLTACGSGPRDADHAGAHTVRAPATPSRYHVTLAHDRFPRDVTLTSLGRGADRVTLLAPSAGHARRTIVFLHGWLAIDPRYYEPWLVHLVRRGATVIYPAYQLTRTLPSRFLDHALTGVRVALASRAHASARASDDVFAVGHSAGATLAVDYAAVACDLGLPPARAVYAVYPAVRLREYPEPIPRRPWEQIRRGTPVIALAGADDHVVGATQARRIARLVPGGHLRTIATPGADRHLAPQRDTAVVRRTLWAPLDRLIARTTRDPAPRCALPSHVSVR